MKKLSLLLVTSLFLVVMTACGSTDSDEEDNAEDVDNGDEDSTITVEHELGETEVEKNPDNVVVFNYGILDTLDELNIDVAAVPQANMPSYLSKYESDEYKDIGTLLEPDFETISEVDPDLIIIGDRQGDDYDELSKIGPTIHLDTDNDHYMESFKDNMETVGNIFEKEEEMDQELAAIDESIDEVNDKVEDSDKDGLIILATGTDVSAYGSGSRFGIIHDVLGVPATDEDIEASTHGQDISFEYVREQNPDLLYVIDRGAAIDEGDTSAKKLVENELTEDTKAYENDDITYLSPDVWYLSGGGLVSVQEMVQEISDSLD